MEISMVIPTIVKNENKNQAMQILSVMKRMTTPTILSPPGIFLLASLTEILELAGVKDAIESGQLEPKLLNICPGKVIYESGKKENIESWNGLKFDLNIKNALKNKMCPIVGVSGLEGGFHAMCAFVLTEYKQDYLSIDYLNNRPSSFNFYIFNAMIKYTTKYS